MTLAFNPRQVAAVVRAFRETRRLSPVDEDAALRDRARTLLLELSDIPAGGGSLDGAAARPSSPAVGRDTPSTVGE